MVREIIQLQVGECGNRVAARIWERVMQEHRINFTYHQDKEDDCDDKFKVYFKETKEKRFIPRGIMIGSNPNQIDMILTGESEKIYQYNYLFNQEEYNHTWTNGNIIYGKKYGDMILDSIRKEAESCDSFQGFQLYHSLSGGTGAGLSSFLLSEIKDEYPDRIISSCSIFPSYLCSDFMCQPYNFVLSIPSMINFVDEMICFDNEAIHKICSNCFKNDNISYGDINFHISQAMSNFTSSFRFSENQFNSDLNKSIENLIPFKNFHFLISRNVPITSRGSTLGYRPDLSIQKFASDLFDNECLLAKCDPQSGSYFAASVYFKGYDTPNEAEEEILKKSLDKKIPNLKVSTFKEKSCFPYNIATMVENTTSVKDVFKRMSVNFQHLYSRRAFLKWYNNDGIEISQFDNSFLCFKNLIDEYESYEN